MDRRRLQVVVRMLEDIQGQLRQRLRQPQRRI